MEGVWKRLELQRKRNDWKPHTTTDVTYLQTAFAFVDVRCEPIEPSGKDDEHSMAFAGLTTTSRKESGGSGGAMTVKWHAFFENDSGFYENRPNLRQEWTAALNGEGLPSTDDIGDFLKHKEDTSRDVWIETDPANTLREKWERISDGDGQFLTLLKKDRTAMLVIVGSFWSIVADARAAPDCSTRSATAPLYATGRIEKGTSWVVSNGLGDTKDLIHKGCLCLPGCSHDDYEVLPGSTIAWPNDERDGHGILPSISFLEKP